MAYSHGFIKRNFFTGKYDREFSGQENAISAAGMVYCNNVLTSPQGECKTRPGTEFVANLDSESVIIPYRRAGKDLALVFSDSQLDVKTFNDAGALVDFVPATTTQVVWTNTDNNTPSSTPLSVTNFTGNTQYAYRFWTWNNYDLTTNYLENRLYVGTGSAQTYPKTTFNMRFTAKKAINRLGMELMTADGNWSASHQQNVKNWINNAVLQYSDDGENWNPVPLVRSVYWSTKRENTPSGTIPIPILWFDTLETAKHEYWRVYIIWHRPSMPNNAPILVRFADTVYEETVDEPQTLTTPYSVDELKKLKYSQQYGQLIVCDGDHKPYMFSMVGNVPTFEEKTYSFIDTDGVPSCVRFFQNRLYFGGFATYPNRVRGSRFARNADASDYTDFQVVSDNATVADPICIECNQFNERITDLWGGFTVLYAQSCEGIAFVTGMTSTPDFTLRCSERASGITPTMKDNIMYYVGYDRRKIYAFSFDNNIQQFVAPDISRHWQEVLKNRVSEIHYVDSRSKCVVGCLEDGNGFFLFHEGRDIGYFPFGINGFISDLSIIKDGDDTHVLMVVQRNGTWMIERLHMPEFMRETNAFEQKGWDRNLATQENIKKSPFFDSWRVVKNEYEQLWQYDAESKIITPVGDEEVPVDLSQYIGKIIRCYYGDGIRDYANVEIQRVFTEQQTEEREVEVTRTVYYYAWQHTGAINITAKPNLTPAWNGTFTRSPSSDLQPPKYRIAWAQGSNIVYSSSENPTVGSSVFRGTDRQVSCATINSLSQTTIWTKSSSPRAGDAVYDNNYEQIGTITSVSGSTITFNNVSYTYNSSMTRYREETHTEIIEVVVEVGQYAVICDLEENTVFNKIQLPIYEIETDFPTIQVQDNGVYAGTFESQDGVVSFEEPMYNIQYGIPYRKIGVIEDNRSYLREKEWGAVAFNVIDTMSLKVGTKLDKLTNMIRWDEKQFFDSNIIMKNGTLMCNIKDVPQYEKLLVFVSDEGLPFTVLAIETAGSISDRGAN